MATVTIVSAGQGPGDTIAGGNGEMRNLSFGGTRRNRLFMAASSLYAVYTATQGPGPA